MYIQGKMPEQAEYKTVVEFIRWALAQQGLSVQEWCEAQEDKVISTQALYNILNYSSVARYPTLYDIATRLGAEININLPYPNDAKK